MLSFFFPIYYLMQYNDVPAILQLNPTLINVIHCRQGQATKQSHALRWYKVLVLTFLTAHGGVLVSTVAGDVAVA